MIEKKDSMLNNGSMQRNLQSVKTIQPLFCVVLLMALSGCWAKHSSKAEALEKCNEWQSKGKEINYEQEMTWKEKFWGFNKTDPEPSIETQDWEEWFEKRKRYFASNPTKKISVAARECKHALNTKQVLGYENQAVSKGVWKNEEGLRGEWVIVKRFRY